MPVRPKLGHLDLETRVPPRMFAGVYRPVSSDAVEGALGDDSIDIVPATDVLIGLACLPSQSLESAFTFAGRRILVTTDTWSRLITLRNSRDRATQAVGARLNNVIGLPRPRMISPENHAQELRLAAAVKRQLEQEVPDHCLDSAVQQAVILGSPGQAAVAISQVGALARMTAPKRTGRVIGAHHLVAFLARHGLGVSADQAWKDAMALVTLKPPVPFFGHPVSAGPVSDQLRLAMLAYIDGEDDCPF